MKSGLYANINAKQKRIAAGSVRRCANPDQPALRLPRHSSKAPRPPKPADNVKAVLEFNLPEEQARAPLGS
jgi:hypothetical protein